MPDLNTLARMMPGLPKAAPANLSGRSPNMGRTITDLSNRGPIPVSGLPSVKLSPRESGRLDSGVKVTMALRLKNALAKGEWGQINERDLQPVQRVLDFMVKDAIALSQGPYSLRQLAAMGHPYGRDSGTPRKVPNLSHVKKIKGTVPSLSVINKQSGNLLRLWSSRLVMTEDGVDALLENSAPYAFYLAAGTRNMQAHGPFTTVAARHRSALLSAWMQVARDLQKQAKAKERQSAAMNLVLESLNSHR